MTKDQVLNKVQKLMAKVDGRAQEAEANSAFAMAQKLLAKYHMTMIDVEIAAAKKDEVIEVENHELLGAAWKAKLAEAVAKNFNCRLLISQDVRYKRSRTPIFVGFPADAEIASQVFSKVMSYCLARRDYHYTKAYDAGEYTYGLMASYTDGFTRGIIDMFQAQKDEINRQAGALVVVVPKEVNEYIDKFTSMSINLTTNRGYNSRAKQTGYFEGKNYEQLL